MSTAAGFGFVGYHLAAELPPLLAGALLFLTPMSFLMSTARNARLMVDRLALVLGLVVGIALAANHVQFDLMWTGFGGGTSRLHCPSLAGGRRMSAVWNELWPYFVLILVGYLPNEIWRLLGSGVGARAQRRLPDRGVVARGGDRAARRRRRQAHPVFDRRTSIRFRCGCA